MILYLHGFRSSPQSFKARLIGQRLAALGLAEQYCCPQLPASPAQAVEVAKKAVEGIAPQSLNIIGSSLGGFYATWLAEQLGCRAVLLNPAVYPRRDLEAYVGTNLEFYTNRPFDFEPEYLDELRALEVAAITHPERYYLLAATGDEVLDWREMASHYSGAHQCIIEGSDHGISDFERYLDDVLAFCGIGTEAGA